MKVVTISGRSGHGKDTTAKFIAKALMLEGHRVLITHFADLLKYICKEFFRWDGQKDEAGRELLQTIGTNMIREIDPDYWLDFMTFAIGLSEDEWDYVIIPDARFPNEVSRIEEAGFDVINIRVERPGFINGLTDTQNNHPSETSIDKIKPDYIITNDCPMYRYQKQITKWTKENLL